MMILTPCKKRPVLQPCTLPDRNYQMDPYIGCEHYCYYCYALNQAETDWRKEILIHKDITSHLESELAGIPPQTIYMGWQTDPYQPCEAECRQTRQVLELLLEKGFSASILTKSDLVLRDTDLLQKMNAASLSFSVAFNDNRIRRLFEANTMNTETSNFSKSRGKYKRQEHILRADFQTIKIKKASLILPEKTYLG